MVYSKEEGLITMITLADVEALRHTEYNSDPVIMEMLATIEELWKRLTSR